MGEAVKLEVNPKINFQLFWFLQYVSTDIYRITGKTEPLQDSYSLLVIAEIVWPMQSIFVS